MVVDFFKSFSAACWLLVGCLLAVCLLLAQRLLLLVLKAEKKEFVVV